MPLQIKRIYEDASHEDGVRILVDRIWPRGVAKKDANIDYWLKEIGPSNELRKWFNHDPDKFVVFKKQYKIELREDVAKEEALSELKEITKKEDKNITLLFGAKEEKYNQAAVLKEIIDHVPT